MLGRELEKRGIRHEVLNAKQHTREAEIVTQAGRIGAVTVATNMAGRGVDILLGGNPEGLAERELRPSSCMAEGDGTDDGVIDLEALDDGASAATRSSSRSSAPSARPRATRCASSAGCSCSAPSATRAVASTTSCVVAPGVRATRARAASTCRSRTTSCASSRPVRSSGSWARAGTTTSRSRRRWSPRPSRRPRTPSRRATARSARTCSSTTR